MFDRLWHWLSANKGPRTRRFRYKYLPHPFASRSEFRYFTVEASGQDEADEKARQYHRDEILGKKKTVLLDFYPA